MVTNGLLWRGFLNKPCWRWLPCQCRHLRWKSPAVYFCWSVLFPHGNLANFRQSWKCCCNRFFQPHCGWSSWYQSGWTRRAGNAALEEIVMAMLTWKDFYSATIRIDITQIMKTSRLLFPLQVSRLNRIRLSWVPMYSLMNRESISMARATIRLWHRIYRPQCEPNGSLKAQWETCL